MFDEERKIQNWAVYLVQALEVIRELQKHFPVKRSPMRLRLIIAEPNLFTLLEKLNAWNANIVSKDESGSQISVVSFSLLCVSIIRSAFTYHVIYIFFLIPKRWYAHSNV